MFGSAALTVEDCTFLGALAACRTVNAGGMEAADLKQAFGLMVMQGFGQVLG
jgi:hypothetical protein